MIIILTKYYFELKINPLIQKQNAYKFQKNIKGATKLEWRPDELQKPRKDLESIVNVMKDFLHSDNKQLKVGRKILLINFIQVYIQRYNFIFDSISFAFFVFN